ncbi:MAG: hypothetical protein AABY34_05115 [Pseudomonadota bacterium]
MKKLVSMATILLGVLLSTQNVIADAVCPPPVPPLVGGGFKLTGFPTTADDLITLEPPVFLNKIADDIYCVNETVEQLFPIFPIDRNGIQTSSASTITFQLVNHTVSVPQTSSINRILGTQQATPQQCSQEQIFAKGPLSIQLPPNSEVGGSSALDNTFNFSIIIGSRKFDYQTSDIKSVGYGNNCPLRYYYIPGGSCVGFKASKYYPNAATCT